MDDPILSDNIINQLLWLFLNQNGLAINYLLQNILRN